MKVLLLLAVAVLSVNATNLYTETCRGRCGERTEPCDCSPRCVFLSFGCCDDYASVCGVYEPPTHPPTSPPPRCKNPGPIANGFISSNQPFFDVGDTVSYSCQDGYNLVGVSSQQTCTGPSYLPGSLQTPHWVPAKQPKCIKPCDNHNCHPMATCTGRPDGSYSCECNTGYEGSGKMCKRIDPCENHLCHKFATCNANHNGFGYTCQCNHGYFGNGFVCKKPCDDHDCHPKATCYGQLDGSYTCKCIKGYEGSGKMCKQPCDNHNCHPMATCNGRPDGSYSCECNTGYEGSGKMCKQIFPCDHSPCHPKADCTNIDDMRYRCDCMFGYTGNGKFCRKLKPCEHEPCHVNATCTDIDDKMYSCECDPGFKGDGKECTRIFPCETNPCHPMATCTDLSYTHYSCKCIYGYRGNGKDCQKIFPCDSNPCRAHTNCVNVGDSYRCDCKSGYFPAGLHSCEQRTCPVPKFLKNGKFRPVQRTYPVGSVVTYTCNDGYELKGSVKRRCLATEKFSGFATCVAINPCKFVDCPAHSTCHVVNGNAVCKCNFGYLLGFGGKCNQIFPCDSDPCGPHTTCVNVGDDSYRCDCVTGYFPAGLHNCEQRTCPVPKFLKNGKFRPVQRTYPVGSVVTYTCNDGYELKGSVKRRCLATGKFSGFATCVEKPTTPPPHSCKNKCGVYSIRTSCACDQDCHRNRNCCPDYATYCNEYFEG